MLQAIDVAAGNDVRHLVLTTGGRSETFAEQLYPNLPAMAFVQMGIFTGASLKRRVERDFTRVSVCAMIGKLSKTAAGKMQTHVAGNQVDCAFLAQVAHEAQHAPDDSGERHREKANTARHVQGSCIETAGFLRFYPRLCESRWPLKCREVVGIRLAVEVVLFDFDGRILARAELT